MKSTSRFMIGDDWSSWIREAAELISSSVRIQLGGFFPAELLTEIIYTRWNSFDDTGSRSLDHKTSHDLV